VSDGLRGDREALNTLFSRYHRLLRSVAYRVLGNYEEAEDAVQNALLMAFSNLQQFKYEGAFRGWLVRILVNEAITLRRKRKRMPVAETSPHQEKGEVLDRIACAQPNPEQVFAKKESIVALAREVERLSAPLRSAVLLCGLKEYSIEEAGKMLRVEQSTIRARLFRARKQLAAAMRSSECVTVTE
jgi:RNA polymerase sigma-70 factor (ECF subfamily)